MESLLTPSESHAFQSFLSSLDASAPEWTLYTSANSEEIVGDAPIPHAQGREALAKATKDLMSLDTDHWHGADSNSARRLQLPHSYDYQHLQIGDPHHQQAPLPHESFPYKHPSYQRPQQQQLPGPSYSDSQHLRPLIVPSSVRKTENGVRSNSESTSPSSATTPNPSSVYQFRPKTYVTPAHNEQQRPRQQPSPKSKKRVPTPSDNSPQKTALLSPSQKKANHIQSEQKRRANIRRGYDALCDTVPTLREAIREEEEKEAEARSSSGKSNGKNGSSKRAGKKKDNESSDRLDGRAGPRSENVVLSKTIDYIHNLHSERQALLNRFHHARAALPPGHPALVPPAEQPLWEREWTGGEGKYDVKNGIGPNEEGEEEEDDESS